MTKPISETPEVSLLPDGRMDTANTALYVGLSIKTMAMLRSNGKGPDYVKIGRIFYYKDELDRWIKEAKVTSTAQRRA